MTRGVTRVVHCLAIVEVKAPFAPLPNSRLSPTDTAVPPPANAMPVALRAIDVSVASALPPADIATPVPFCTISLDAIATVAVAPAAAEVSMPLVATPEIVERRISIAAAAPLRDGEIETPFVPR